MKIKIDIDGEGLKSLAKAAIRAGTERNWISIALEWIEHAEAEIYRLSLEIERLKRK